MQTFTGPRHAATAKVLRQFWRRYGFGPTIRELAADVGCSPASMYERLVKMERAGLVTHVPNTARSWSVVERV